MPELRETKKKVLDRVGPDHSKVVRVRKQHRHHISWAGVVTVLLGALFGAVLYTCAMMENAPKKGLPSLPRMSDRSPSAGGGGSA
jgi:hypothetical protein